MLYKGQEFHFPLLLPDDITEVGLPLTLRRELGIADSVNVNIYRFSKSARRFVLMQGKDEFSALIRCLRVKKKFTFEVKEESGGVGDNENAGEHAEERAEENVASEQLECSSSMQKINDERDDERHEERHHHHGDRHRHRDRTDKLEAIVEKLRANDSFREMVESLILAAVDQMSVHDKEAEKEETIDEKESQKEESKEKDSQGGAERNDLPPPASHPEQHSSHPVNTSGPVNFVRVPNKAFCDNCEAVIVGNRYKCVRCSDFDLCDKCINTSNHFPNCEFLVLSDVTPMIVREKSAAPSSFPQCEVAPAPESPTPYFQVPASSFSVSYVCNGPLCQDNEISGAIYACTTCPDTHFCSNCANLENWVHDPTHTLRVLLNGDSPSSYPVSAPPRYAALPCIRMENGKYHLSLINIGTQPWPASSKLRAEPTLGDDYDWSLPFETAPRAMITFDIEADVFKRVDKWFMDSTFGESFEVANFGLSASSIEEATNEVENEVDSEVGNKVDDDQTDKEEAGQSDFELGNEYCDDEQQSDEHSNVGDRGAEDEKETAHVVNSREVELEELTESNQDEVVDNEGSSSALGSSKSSLEGSEMKFPTLLRESPASSLCQLETTTDEGHDHTRHSDLEILSDLGTAESYDYSEDEYEYLTSADLNN